MAIQYPSLGTLPVQHNYQANSAAGDPVVMGNPVRFEELSETARAAIPMAIVVAPPSSGTVYPFASLAPPSANPAPMPVAKVVPPPPPAPTYGSAGVTASSTGTTTDVPPPPPTNPAVRAPTPPPSAPSHPLASIMALRTPPHAFRPLSMELPVLGSRPVAPRTGFSPTSDRELARLEASLAGTTDPAELGRAYLSQFRGADGSFADSYTQARTGGFERLRLRVEALAVKRGTPLETLAQRADVVRKTVLDGVPQELSRRLHEHYKREGWGSPPPGFNATLSSFLLQNRSFAHIHGGAYSTKLDDEMTFARLKEEVIAPVRSERENAALAVEGQIALLGMVLQQINYLNEYPDQINDEQLESLTLWAEHMMDKITEHVVSFPERTAQLNELFEMAGVTVAQIGAERDRISGSMHHSAFGTLEIRLQQAKVPGNELTPDQEAQINFYTNKTAFDKLKFNLYSRLLDPRSTGAPLPVVFHPPEALEGAYKALALFNRTVRLDTPVPAADLIDAVYSSGIKEAILTEMHSKGLITNPLELESNDVIRHKQAIMGILYRHLSN
ncbi:MAG: hypothetical protein SP1CHLAM54_06220 [Chlamydiia bacterium]|nr:hypothetical protein [Chlamydiia bacterium]MCH9615532.1 hypothetical protein [Chlamydiia bacterium]MCH9629187.1 hypothetical protein [Chlamydiia bacterium]